MVAVRYLCLGGIGHQALHTDTSSDDLTHALSDEDAYYVAETCPVFTHFELLLNPPFIFDNVQQVPGIKL